VTDGVTVLGVRHHGPGSSRSLVRALERIEPDLVLVEGPPDGDGLVKFVAQPGMQPPVALVVYPRDRPASGVFYPFAVFSPEWNAMRFALERNIPIRFCDLPQAIALASREPRELVDEAEPPDPISLLSQAAGESDPERWWERVVEQRRDDTDVFRAVTEAIAGVREALPTQPLHEARREAYMRSTIRSALSGGYANIVVVCGAWHAPALESLPPRKHDDLLLRRLPRLKVAATWVPWTASRLAYLSGYGAGVESPAWYRHLWDTNGDLVAWLTSAARLLREEDLDASPAQVVDAVRLAETLSALRGRPRPSLSEVGDATLSVLCNGETARMRLVERRLIVGEEIGALPPGVPVLPLQADVETQARHLRLRMTPEQRLLDLDLRQDHALQQSRFLHRLNLLGIDWGRVQPPPPGKLGTFHELWLLRWRPEMVLQVVSAAMYGNTLLEAATARAVERAERNAELGSTAELVQQALLADLERAVAHLVSLLTDRSAEATDVSELLRALPPLAATLRYGDVRRTDATALAGVIRGLAERARVGLAPATEGLDDEAAAALAAHIVAATHALNLLVEQIHADVVADWWTALRELVDRADATTRLISGTCTRLVLNAQRLSTDQAETCMARALARGTSPPDAARWIEGFLSPRLGGSGLILATSTRMFGLIDAWLTELAPDFFGQILPLLRRSTSSFSEGERRQIAQRVRSGRHSVLAVDADGLNLARAARVETVVRHILGIEA
jgi:hypothetical protein